MEVVLGCLFCSWDIFTPDILSIMIYFIIIFSWGWMLKFNFFLWPFGLLGRLRLPGSWCWKMLLVVKWLWLLFLILNPCSIWRSRVLHPFSIVCLRPKMGCVKVTLQCQGFSWGDTCLVAHIILSSFHFWGLRFGMESPLYFRKIYEEGTLFAFTP